MVNSLYLKLKQNQQTQFCLDKNIELPLLKGLANIKLPLILLIIVHHPSFYLLYRSLFEHTLLNFKDHLILKPHLNVFN